MIKVGDEIKSKQTGTIFKILGIDRKIIWLNGGGYLLKEDLDKFETPYDEVIDYKQLYEQQKQRADELEKQIRHLKRNYQEELNSNKEMYIKMCEAIKSADKYENRWNELKEQLNETWLNGDACEHEYAYNVMKKMNELEEQE